VIILRNEQLDVFRADSRKNLPEAIRRDLVKQGLSVEQQDSALILRDSLKQLTRLSFATDGLPKSIVRPSGLAFLFEYDKAGRLAAINYPGGRQLAFSCVASGNVTQLSQPGFAQYQLSYAEPAKESALLESVTYPDGRIREFSYDDTGQVIAITEPSGACYDFERDERGAIAAIIDPLLREIALISDDAGALQGIEFPDGSLEAFLFDEEEQTAVRVHRDGSETHYKLDDQERIAQIVSGAEGATSFGYNEQGQLNFVEQAGQRVSFKTEGDNTIEEHGPDGKVCYEYDGDGRLTGLKNPFGDRLHYAYDQDGRLANIKLWDGRSIQIESNDEDLNASFQFPGGVVVHQHYGPALRLSRREVQTANGIVQQVSYGYDECSRFTGYAEAAPQSRQCQISYDEDDHVVREVTNGQSQHFTFDIKGNMVQAGDLEIRVGPMDEPLRYGDQVIDYDARGNMLRLPGVGGALECRYRHDGMLTECHGAAGTVTFKYDALGRRIEKRSKEQIWRFGWTGYQLLWEEYKAAEHATPVRRDYLFLPGTTQPLGFREQGRCYWLMTDARGAVDLALDDHGQVVWKARYDSFGRVELAVNKVRQPWRMPGQYADDETGLYIHLFCAGISISARCELTNQPVKHWMHP
jgi:YD repeat-containing protein